MLHCCFTCIIICCRHFYLSTNSMLQSLSIEIHYAVHEVNDWPVSYYLRRKNLGIRTFLKRIINYTKRTLEYWRDNVVSYPFISIKPSYSHLSLYISVGTNSKLSDPELNLTDNSPRSLYVLQSSLIFIEFL